MKSFTNEGADKHAGAPGPALPPDAAHEGGAGNAPGAAATHEGGAADDPAGAAPPAEAAGVAPPAPLLAAPEIQAAAPAEEESQPRTRRPRPDDGQRVGTWRTARRGNQMYSSSCTLLDLRAGTEERQYVTEVILRFGEGRLPNVPDNTSLRVLLSTVLNCSPMRITRCANQTSALKLRRTRLIGGFALRHHEEILGQERAPARALPPHRRAGARGPRAAPDARARVPPARPGRRREAHDEPLRHVRPAHAAVPRRRHHHGAGSRRSPLADREALALALADGVPGPSADADGSGPVVLRRAGPGGALHRSGARLRRGLAGAAGAPFSLDRGRRPAGPCVEIKFTARSS